MLPAGFDGRFLQVGEVRLHLVEGGAGAPVVMLHGWPATWRVWRKVMPTLAQTHRVIAPDLRGLGESDAPWDGYDKRTLARDVWGLIDALGHSRVTLISHDLGASVAYSMACLAPERVERLVLMDDPLPGLGAWREKIATRWHFAFNCVPGLPEKLVAGREREFFGWFYGNAFQKSAFSDEDIRLYLEAYSRPESLRAGFEYYRSIEKDAADNAADHTVLTMPVLALGGDHSYWKTFLHEQLQGRATDLTGEVVPDCAHFIPEERPDWLVPRLQQFLSGATT